MNLQKNHNIKKYDFWKTDEKSKKALKNFFGKILKNYEILLIFSIFLIFQKPNCIAYRKFFNAGCRKQGPLLHLHIARYPYLKPKIKILMEETDFGDKNHEK